MKKSIIWIVYFALLASLIYANTGSVNTFSNDLTAENITFAGNDSHTRFIDIPRYGYVDNFSISYKLDFPYSHVGRSGYFYNFSNFKEVSYLDVGSDIYDFAGDRVAGVKFMFVDDFIGRNAYGSWSTSLYTAIPDCSVDNYSSNDLIVFNNVTNNYICFNTSDGNFVIARINYLDGSSNIYFDWGYYGLYFNISIITENLSIYNQDIDLNYSNKINISLNNTVINTILSSGCTCTNCSIVGDDCRIPITFHSDTAGILEYSGIDLNYSYGIGACSDDSYNYTIMNISYRDEATLINISASNSYELTVSDPFSQSFSGVFATAKNHEICTNVNATARGYNISIYGIMTAQSSGYETRIIERGDLNPYVTGTSPYFPLIIYLIDSGNASEVEFTLKDSLTKSVINGAQVDMYELYNGSYLLVESKLSDVTGKVVFDYIEDRLYRVIFSAESYTTLTHDFNPISSSSYDVFLTKTTIQNITQTFDRIYINWEPKLFYEGGNNFSITFYSPYGELNSYSYELEYPSNTTTGAGTTISGETFTTSFNITNPSRFDRVKLTWNYNTDLAGDRSGTEYYDIIVNPGNYTLMRIKDTDYGLGLFERLFISVFSALLILGISSLIGNVPAGMFLAFSWLGYLVFITFIPIWSILISVFVAMIIISGRSD